MFRSDIVSTRLATVALWPALFLFFYQLHEDFLHLWDLEQKAAYFWERGVTEYICLLYSRVVCYGSVHMHWAEFPGAARTWCIAVRTLYPVYFVPKSIGRKGVLYIFPIP